MHRRLPIVVATLLAAATLAGVAPATHAQPGDWGVKRDPFDKHVIARYKAILTRNPHDGSALAKLLEMYRRYRTIDVLKDEYQKQIDKKHDDWAALVVLGRLMHTTGDDARAREQWQKAVAAKDGDTETWIAIGALDKSAGKNKDARAAYDKALAHATSKDTKKKALRALADLALATGDTDGANAYFKQFLDLDPKNAQLWIDRGDAMLAAGKRQIALDSYSAAEKLLGTDPARHVEIVARRGQALEGMGRDDEAVAEYRRAIKLAPKGYSSRSSSRAGSSTSSGASKRCRPCSPSTRSSGPNGRADISSGTRSASSTRRPARRTRPSPRSRRRSRSRRASSRPSAG